MSENHNHVHDENCECDTLVITLDDDSEVECNVIGIFEVDDKEYIALLPIEEETVLIYQYQETKDSVELTSIEDDDEFKAVTDAFFELYNEDDDFQLTSEEQ